MIPIFIVNVYKDDPTILRQCLTRLRMFYLTSPLVMIADGDQNMIYSDLAFEFKARLTMGSRLKLPQCGGAWSKRMYTEGLREQGDTIIKLDPDSYMWRAFETDPAGDYCGYIRGGRKPHIHGACKSLSVTATRSVLEDFSNSKYVNNDEFTYLKNGERVISDDLITADVMQERNIPLTNWPEISPFPLESSAIFAVTHGYTKVVQQIHHSP